MNLKPDEIKSLFLSSVVHVASSISKYAANPDTDFNHTQKLPPQKLIQFLVAEGSSSTKNELLVFWAGHP